MLKDFEKSLEERNNEQKFKSTINFSSLGFNDSTAKSTAQDNKPSGSGIININAFESHYKKEEKKEQKKDNLKDGFINIDLKNENE